jgi:hypothetical protein
LHRRSSGQVFAPHGSTQWLQELLILLSGLLIFLGWCWCWCWCWRVPFRRWRQRTGDPMVADTGPVHRRRGLAPADR